MCEILQNEKNRFLADEFFAASWNAAVRRNTTFAKLDEQDSKDKKDKFRECLKEEIFNMLPKYAETSVSHEQHLKNIEALIKASKDFSDILKNCGTEENGESDPNAKGMKAATAQKILNVMLKYCWCAGWINMPPDMPIDSRVLAELKKAELKKEDKNKNGKQFQISWTKDLIAMDDYKTVIEAAAATVEEPLAIWELKNWQHRVDENKEKSDTK